MIIVKNWARLERVELQKGSEAIKKRLTKHFEGQFVLRQCQKKKRSEFMAGVFLTTADQPSLAFVCFFGIAVVFVGLIVLIGCIYLMNFLCDKLVKQKAPEKASAPAPVASKEIANRGEIVAAVCAAVAEEEGTDISAIRVISFKKL